MLVTGGWYLTEGQGANGPTACPLIYNPPWITHRDRFCERGGSFFTLTLSPAALEAARDADLCPASVSTLIRDAGARSIAHRLSRLFSRPSPGDGLTIEALCLELTAALSNPRRTERGPPSWLPRAREILNEEYGEPLAIKDLAAGVGVHPIHLARAFRAWYGSTPGDYLRGRRLEMAAELLIHGRLSLVEVALKSGFADQSHLTKGFSAAYGVPPGKYRRWVQGGHVTQPHVRFRQDGSFQPS